MCQVVYIDGERIDTMAKLRDKLGVDGVVIDYGYNDEPPAGNSCLCPVNLEATAAAAGRSLWRDNNMTATMTLPGQRYEYHCEDCNMRVPVDAIDEHFETCHGSRNGGRGGMSCSGPHLVGPRG